MSSNTDYLSALDVATIWKAIEAAAERAELAVYVARIDVEPPALLYMSPRASQILGRSAADLRVVPWEILDVADQARIRAEIAQPVDAPAFSMEVFIERPDRTRVPIVYAGTRIRALDAMLVFGYFRDVSGEHAARIALEQSAARFRSLVEAAPDGVAILQRGRIVFINPKAAQLLGVTDPATAIGRSIADYLPARDAEATSERIAEMFRTGREMTPSEYGVLADPNRVVEIKSILTEWESAPAVLAFARDVTERKAIQQRLIEADRLAALGTLAAGVAHEINNPLTYARLSVERIDRALADPAVPAATAAAVREYVADISHGLARVASIAESLRTFVRANDTPPGPVDLDAVIDRSLKLVDNELRHRAQLIRTGAATTPVTGNASRLEQVFVNLLLNAVRAFRDNDVARNQIELSVTANDHGGTVVIVRDTGQGMSASVREHVFEPFFTTRAVGDGMGLGLSVCRNIVESVGGEIRVESTEGVGTVVTVVLAAHRGSAPAITPPRAPRAPDRRRRVLIVDDERLVRDVLDRTLSETHDTTVTAGGAAALAAMAGGSFDAILCDVMMPGMSGHELYRRVAAEFPGAERRIIFMTGGVFTHEVGEFLASIQNRCITKPFALDDVLAAVAELVQATT